LTATGRVTNLAARLGDRASGDDRAVLAPGALYFALVFAAGRVFGPVRELLVASRVGRTAGVLAEASLMLLVIVVAAPWTVRR